MFKLTDEEIDEIIEQYGSSKRIISKIEFKLNFLEIVDDKEDYIELIKSIVSQYVSIQTQINSVKANENSKSNYIDKKDLARLYMDLDEIIETELNRKYKDLTHKEIQLQKLYSQK